MIWVDGKQYRDADEFAREYLESPQQPEVEAQPESEDSMIRREQIEAFDRATFQTKRAGEPAEVGRCFQNRHVVSGPHEIVAGSKAGEAPADHDDPLGFRRHRSVPARTWT